MSTRRPAYVAALFGLAALSSACNEIADWDGMATPSPEPSEREQRDISVTSSTLSAEHSCAIIGSGPSAFASCWGRNAVGQLGTGDIAEHLTPSRVVDLDGVSAIGTGLLHTCAVDRVGAVACWGSNRYAALGRGTRDDDPHTKPERVAGIDDVASVHCGMNFSCVRTKGQTVACWGTNDFGQLGDGTTNTVRIPKPLAALNDVTSLSAGGQHVCAIARSATSERAVYCWGFNERAQLGATAAKTQAAPTEVSGLDGAHDVVTGDAHTCAIVGSRRTLKCWGANDSGQLGAPPSDDRPSPVDVPGLSDVASVSVGSKHTCAVARGELYCWGSNARGQLGVAPRELGQDARPRRVVATGVLEQIELGYTSGEHTCAVRPDRSLYCWGWNGEGQLGNGTREATSKPSEVRFFLSATGAGIKSR